MSKPRRPADSNQRAKLIVDLATGAATELAPKAKNQAAAMLGRAGGLASAKVRMEKISANKRSAIAKKAAKARWAPKKKSPHDNETD